MAPRRFSSTSSSTSITLLSDHEELEAGKARCYGSCSKSAADEKDPLINNGDVDVDLDIYTSPLIEAQTLARYSIPLIATYLLQYSFSIVMISVVGHIGTKELGALSLASMIVSITGLAVFEGLATSLDTLCSQAYTSGDKTLVGLHVQRMALFFLLVLIPIGVIWLNSGFILTKFISDRDLALLTGRFLRILFLGAPGHAMFEVGKRFVQAQGMFNAPLFTLLVCAPLNILFNYLFVFHFHWGVTGAALANSISRLLLPVPLFLYIRFISRVSLTCWNGFTREALHSWGPMIRLAIPSVIMVGAEWIAFNIVTFSASYLTVGHLAAQSILYTTSVFMCHIPFAISVAASTRLGNLVGAESLSAAKIAARTYCTIFVILGLFNASLIFSLRNIIPRFFSDDIVVMRIVVGVMPVLMIYQFFDSTTALAHGLLRGLGRQSIGGWLNLAVYYAVAVPLALFLCFGPLGLKLQGLWIGFVLGCGLITCFEGSYLWWFDWSMAVREAKSRQG